MTGPPAALDAGPAVILSYAIAGPGLHDGRVMLRGVRRHGPVAGIAYTYAYATLGEIFAWIIGWDLILEYAMGCATVASAWTKYFNKLLPTGPSCRFRRFYRKDPYSGGWINLPSVIIMARGGPCARHSRNAAYERDPGDKLGVVLFVIAARLRLRPSGKLDQHSRCQTAIFPPNGE